MNPIPTNGQMTFKDAALVAAILMLSSIATLFLPFHTYEGFVTDLGKSLYEILTFAFVAWITYFVALTGLNAYAKRAQETGG